MVAKSLFSLNHTATQKRMDKIIRGQIIIEPRPLKLRGKTQWDDDLPITEPHMVPMPLCRSRPAHPSIVLVQCPKCKKQESSLLLTSFLSPSNLDKAIKCKHCKSQSQSKDWKCNCGIPWFTCDQHCHPHNQQDNRNRNQIPASLQTEQHAGDPSRLNKRMRVEHDFESLLSQDQQRHKIAKYERVGTKRPAVITLGAASPGLKVPRRLGPILGQRFKRLYSQTDTVND